MSDDIEEKKPKSSTAGLWHSPPVFVRAPQRLPGQLGPKRVSRPIDTLPFVSITFAPIRLLSNK